MRRRVRAHAIARNAAVRAFFLFSRCAANGARLFAHSAILQHFVNDGHSVVVSSNNKGERLYLPYVVKRARKHQQNEEPHETLYDSGCRRTY